MKNLPLGCPKDSYVLLPQTNCKQCGEATCPAFAVTLITGKWMPDECTPLQTESTYDERKTTPEAML